MSLIRTVDRFLYRVVTRDLRNEHIERYVTYLAVDHDETSVPNLIGRGFQIIDSKAGGTPHPHLDDDRGARRFSAGRRQRLFGAGRDRGGDHVLPDGRARLLALPFHVQDDLEKPAKEAARDELILRHKLFRLCNRAAILLTLLVLLSLPVLYLYVPTKAIGT
jgi:hypothetical protein